jgi:hypothetical protein
MERIRYRCDKAEMRKPIALRKTWHVLLGDKQIATISTREEPSTDHSHSLRIWTAKVHGGEFDPFDFPHVDEDDEGERLRPHVTLAGGQPFLINPQPMTMKEARSWVKHVVQRGDR